MSIKVRIVEQNTSPLHEYEDRLHSLKDLEFQQIEKFTYKFENFFHPFAENLIEKLNSESLAGLLDPGFHEKLEKEAKPFDHYYNTLQNSEDFRKAHPKIKNLVEVIPPEKKIDLSLKGSYSNYNWELLFHIPLTIAVHLSKNQRFAEAQRWFHYIFDPTCNDTSIPVPKRYWKFLDFRRELPTQIEKLLMLLSKSNDELSDDELSQRDEVLAGYNALMDKPFQPHAVARTRRIAYQYCVVMKYLDNLITWGDTLFRQDTVESINEATQLYVLAANLLGERPQRIPPKGTSRPKTFKQLKDQGLDRMGNALVELEGQFPCNVGMPNTQPKNPEHTKALFGIGRTLYFCIPRNDKLLSYWDTVADRLFKIRHCMNIEGIVRQLALFDPPIDPGMLVKAAAAGINVGVIVSGLNQPVGSVRSLFLIQKALELCSEVRGLGNALLSALEKRDSEHLALLRQGHEIKIQQMQQEVRFLQWKQARESTESLLKSRTTTLERFHYYQRLLGLPADQNALNDITPDRRELTEENFDEAYNTLVGQYDKTITLQSLPDLKRAEDSSPGSQSGYSGSGKLYLTLSENVELNVHLPAARDTTIQSAAFHSLAATLTPIPDPKVDLHYWGLGGTVDLKIGTVLATLARLAGDAAGIRASWERDQAGMASKSASHERRADEWLLQYNLTAHELMQQGRQLIASLISEQIAYREYQNIQKQIQHSQEVDQFLHEKYTNEELYVWMQGEISRLYYEYYRFAFDTARKAEQTIKHELMRSEVDSTDYIKFNYWDSGRKGLLSGEALYLDIKRMEMAYHENNKREYELTKHVSLRQLAPLALLALKATGTCEVTVPEWLFDLDCPGHYMRRIKTVSLSIPSVTGPYTSVNCTLSLLKSSLRKSPLVGEQYERAGSEDDRFIDYYGTIQSIVTSSGNNDSGMFETNLRDERFLPFEGSGAESTWKLELPSNFRQFDYNTISDVILHIRYTARPGGGQVRDKAVEYIEGLVSQGNQSGLALLFSLKNDFPGEWSRFVSATDNSNFTTIIRRDYFPYITQGKNIAIDSILLYSIKTNEVEVITPPELNLSNFSTHLNSTESKFQVAIPSDPAILKRDPAANVFLVVKYSLS